MYRGGGITACISRFVSAHILLEHLARKGIYKGVKLHGLAAYVPIGKPWEEERERGPTFRIQTSSLLGGADGLQRKQEMEGRNGGPGY